MKLLTTLLLSMSSLYCAADVTLSQCVDSALINNGLVSAARVSLEKSRILEGTAFDPDMTSVTLKQTTMDAGNPDNGIAFGQNFDFPTLYVARHKALKAETSLKRAELDKAAAEVRRDVTAAYFKVLYTAHVIKLRKSTLEHFARFSDVCRTRYEKGEISKLQYISARSISGINERDYDAAVNDYRAACSELQTLTGCSDVTPADTLYCFSDPVSQPVLSAFAGQPELNILENQMTLDRRNYSLAKQAFLPGITVGATTQCYISGFNPYNVVREKFGKGNFMSFEVGVTVPLFFTGKRAAMRAAKRDLVITGLEYDQRLKELQNAAAVSYANIDNYRRQVKYYRNTAVPEAIEMHRLAEVEYQHGEITYHEFMEYVAASVEVKLKYAETVNAYNQECIKYNFLTNR